MMQGRPRAAAGRKGPRAVLVGGVLVAAGALAMGLMPPAAPVAKAGPQFPEVPANGELGFVLTEFWPAVHQGKEDCPDGLAGTVRENYLATLSEAERSRLLRKENEEELTHLWKASGVGPNNTNLCTNPELFPRPDQKTVQGKVAYGLNLDGDSSGHPADGCAHAEFTGVDGEPGVDNQAYRALGCTRNWRGVDGVAGDIKGFNNFLATGEHTMVLRLRGVKSFKDSADVEVLMASTDDRPVMDTKRNFIAGTSFTVSNPRWRNVLHGRIHDGVLITDPVDIRLNRRLGHGGLRGQRSEYDLRRARLRLAIQPDGSIKGLLGAYQTPRNLIETTLIGGIGVITTAGIDCATEFHTLTRLADGLKDPTTGRCTAVSNAYAVAGVPAFVNDLSGAGDAASAGTSGAARSR